MRGTVFLFPEPDASNSMEASRPLTSTHALSGMAAECPRARKPIIDMSAEQHHMRLRAIKTVSDGKSLFRYAKPSTVMRLPNAALGSSYNRL